MEHPAGAGIVSIHAPRGGSDLRSFGTWRQSLYFNPRSPWGERPYKVYYYATPILFQSTLPVGGATNHLAQTGASDRFQSTLPVGGATDASHDLYPIDKISIHAPRVGSDSSLLSSPSMDFISIHAPRVGSDLKPMTDKANKFIFQSTLPVWGATRWLPGRSRAL